MNTPESGDFADRMNLEMAATGAGQAADADAIILLSEAEIATANAAALAAQSPEDRLAAELLLQAANLRIIGAMAADSFAEWELSKLIDPDT